MNLKTKIFISTFLAGIALVFISLAAFYFFSARVVKNQSEKFLISTSQAQVNHLKYFIKSLKNDVSAVDYLLENDSFDEFDHIKKTIESIVMNNDSFYAAEYIDSSGIKIYSYGFEDVGNNQNLVNIKKTFFKDLSNEVIFSEAILLNGIETVVYSETLIDSNGNSLGDVIFYQSLGSISEEYSAYSILIDRIGIGETEEHYLVNSNGYMVSPSRFLEDTFLKTKVNTRNFSACLSEISNSNA